MVAQTIRLAGKRFVIVEEKQYERLLQSLRQGKLLNAQDSGDVAESRRRLKEPGESIPWETIKAKRGTKAARGNGKKSR
jgi:hypothetical protein